MGFIYLFQKEEIPNFRIKKLFSKAKCDVKVFESSLIRMCTLTIC
jgi:hypothetical protein